MTLSINGISIPDSQLARDVTQLVRDTLVSAAVPSFQPGLLFWRLGRQTSRSAFRSGTAL